MEGDGEDWLPFASSLLSSSVCFLSLSLSVDEKSSERRVDSCSQNMDCTSNSLHSVTQS